MVWTKKVLWLLGNSTQSNSMDNLFKILGPPVIKTDILYDIELRSLKHKLWMTSKPESLKSLSLKSDNVFRFESYFDHFFIQLHPIQIEFMKLRYWLWYFIHWIPIILTSFWISKNHILESNYTWSPRVMYKVYILYTVCATQCINNK